MDPRIIQLSKGLPDGADWYTEPELRDVAITFMADSRLYVARQVFAGVNVAMQGGKYPIYSKADMLRDEMEPRADGAPSALGEFRISRDNYFCDPFSLAKDVGPMARKNNPQADRAATRYLAGKALIKGEVQFAAAAWGTGIWTTELTGADTTPDADDEFLTWMDDDAFPIETIETAIEQYDDVAAGFPINRLVFSSDVWKRFKSHPNVLARFNNGQTSGGAKVTIQALQDLLEIERVIVAKARRTTSAKGVAEASSTFGRILGTGVMGCHAAANASTEEPSAGYHFDWEYAPGANGVAVTSEPVPNTGGAIRYTIDTAFDVKLTSADLGFWLEDVLHAAP